MYVVVNIAKLMMQWYLHKSTLFVLQIKLVTSNKYIDI